MLFFLRLLIWKFICNFLNCPPQHVQFTVFNQMNYAILILKLCSQVFRFLIVTYILYTCINSDCWFKKIRKILIFFYYIYVQDFSTFLFFSGNENCLLQNRLPFLSIYTCMFRIESFFSCINYIYSHPFHKMHLQLADFQKKRGNTFITI